MIYRKHFVLFTITLITLFVSTIVASGAVDIPAPKMHVADRAKIIDKQTESRLNAFLSELETKTGAQMVVLTVKTTGGVPVDQFSIDLANAWKLGQFDQNNGVLVVVAIKDRKYSIEVGSGLESVLTNDFCAEIGKVLFVPNFRNGNFNEGIYQGSAAIINKIAKDAGVTISGAPTRAQLPRRRGSGLSFLPILLIFILPMLGVLGIIIAWRFSDIVNWYLTVLKKYAVFDGRARRKEYWYFYLLNFIVCLILAFIGVAINPEGDKRLGISNIYTLGILIPSLAVGARRMHDVGKSGWFQLIPIYNIILFVTGGDKGDNQYGPDPITDV
jgi:uncharacterized protein